MDSKIKQTVIKRSLFASILHTVFYLFFAVLGGIGLWYSIAESDGGERILCRGIISKKLNCWSRRYYIMVDSLATSTSAYFCEMRRILRASTSASNCR
ncbi:MAG: hypothetical protein FWB96_01660 [Defluviitaleaceae bacterium]|nr:hypothetical protein [Defluviitaleaceae bacterium]MCL2261600.1 hypothetical protein [Defluviitaleaceae bacterium]